MYKSSHLNNKNSFKITFQNYSIIATYYYTYNMQNNNKNKIIN